MLAGGGWETQVRALQRPIDLLVGTPQRVLQHAAKGNLAFGDVRWLVLDEADTMFDAGKTGFGLHAGCSADFGKTILSG